MKNHISRFGHILLMVVLVVTLFSVIVMLLWNWLMPAIFRLGTINFWQALGLLALARILFGGMMGKHWEKHKKWHHHNALRNKFMKMSDEERKDFMKRRFLQHDFVHDFFEQDESGKND